MYRIFMGLWEILFPARCALCGAPGSGLCARCAAALPLSEPLQQKEWVAAYDYGDRAVQKAIWQMKYYRRGEVALALARAAAPHITEFVADALQSAHGERVALVPIPQHKRRSASRGFNPSEAIARAIARELENAHVERFLIKTRHTSAQARVKSKTARLENLRGSMRAARGALSPHALHIIVDDVTTTGATFIEATRALRAAGAKKILCIALAHGHARKK